MTQRQSLELLDFLDLRKRKEWVHILCVLTSKPTQSLDLWWLIVELDAMLGIGIRCFRNAPIDNRPNASVSVRMTKEAYRLLCEMGYE